MERMLTGGNTFRSSRGNPGTMSLQRTWMTEKVENLARGGRLERVNPTSCRAKTLKDNRRKAICSDDEVHERMGFQESPRQTREKPLGRTKPEGRGFSSGLTNRTRSTDAHRDQNPEVGLVREMLLHQAAIMESIP
jgi:hypothetical protein